MGIDRIKLTGSIKIFVFFTYLIYFSLSNLSLIKFYANNNELKTDTELKRGLLSKKCLFLLGGSNVRMGLSAEAASSKSCEALNLGVSAEGGGFQKYVKWLKSNAVANKVIYSSADIWTDAPLSNSSEEEGIKFPATSLFSFINIIFFPDKNLINPEVNHFGDQIEYKCFNNYRPFYINLHKFTDFDYLVSLEMYKRIYVLKEITNSDEIFLRIPPIYVKNKNQAIAYENLMIKRIEILRSFGIKIVDSTIVSADGSLFCDASHPNAKGREAFTKEIAL